jgi:hypothetical protein
MDPSHEALSSGMIHERMRFASAVAVAGALPIVRHWGDWMIQDSDDELRIRSKRVVIPSCR